MPKRGLNRPPFSTSIRGINLDEPIATGASFETFYADLVESIHSDAVAVFWRGIR